MLLFAFLKLLLCTLLCPLVFCAVVLLQTSIVFTLGKGAGVLFKALSVFALRDINLTKVRERSNRPLMFLSEPPGNPAASRMHHMQMEARCVVY